MDAVSLKLARNYTNEKLNSLPSNRPTKTVSFDGGIYSIGSDVVNGQVSDIRLKGQSIFQFVKNGNFADGTTNWETYAGTLSSSNNILTLTPDSTTAVPFVWQVTNKPFETNKKIFIRARVRVTNSECQDITLRLEGTATGGKTATSTGLIINPVQNQWYTLYFVFDTSSFVAEGDLRIKIYKTYIDSATANGKVMEVQEVMAIDLDQHPQFDGMTADEINKAVPNWLPFGVKSTNSVRVKSVGKNLFDVKACEGKTGWRVDPVRAVGTGIEVSGYIPSGFVGYAEIPYKLKPNTQYVISYNAINTQNQIPVCSVLNSNRVIIGNNVMGSGKKQKTFITDGVGSGIFRFYSTGFPVGEAGVYTTTYEDIQLEEGTTATPYEPYKESTVYINAGEELRSLPNGVKDEVNVTEGKLVKRVSDSVIITGDSGFHPDYFVSSGETYRCAIPNWSINNNAMQGISNSGLALCEDGEFPVYDNTYGIRSIYFANNHIWVLIEKTKVDVMDGATTLEKFKTYLNQYPITLTYQLATPVVTKITPQKLEVFENGTIYVEPIGDPAESTLPSVELTVPVGQGNQYGIATHDYQAAAADWVLSSNEAKCMLLKTTNAGAAVNIIAPDRPGVLYAVNNTSGQAVTIKKSGGTGVAIVTGKTALVMHNGTDYIKLTGEV